MYPRAFEYIRSQSVAEALGHLSRLGEEAKVLAGGQSLIPMMKLRLAGPSYIVDLGGIPGLSYIREEDGHIALGAFTRHREVEESSLLRSRFPIIPEAIGLVGDVQVRNMGTVGGSLAHGEMGSDWGPVSLALNAQLRAVGPGGERRIAAKEFFLDLYTTALSQNELLAEVLISLPPPNSSGAYLKMVRRAGDFAVASVAMQMTVDDGGKCLDVGIGLGGVGLTPIKAVKAEAALKGEKVTEAVLRNAAAIAAQEADPVPDIRGSAEYRRELVKVLCYRVANIALGRIRGEAVEGGYV
ncbi:MAG: xanthine dehydrogenase family protein subunit M [Chloroflexi bacterium]|nr:xanthine dehydrogenase family protein subunit M [Chloroflexota bacterium]